MQHTDILTNNIHVHWNIELTNPQTLLITVSGRLNQDVAHC